MNVADPNRSAQTERARALARPAPTLDTPISAKTSAVVGLQWGDEGKGKVIDALAGNFKAVVRYNGGANAGHSVVIRGRRHALHLVPSGVFHPDVAAVIANGVVVDPIALVGEIDALRNIGVDPANLVLSDRAHLVLPWHKAEDALREALLAGAPLSADEQNPSPSATPRADHSIGTTRRGIGPAYADKASRSTALRVGDMLRPDVLADKLERIARFKTATLRALDPNAEAPDPHEIERQLEAAAERLAPHVADTTYLLHEMLRRGEPILFEGANATLLDIDHGTFPFVTSSTTTTLGIPAGTGIPPTAVSGVVGVLKAYSTRVGAGPFPTELEDDTGARIRERGREYGTTTGRPRRCGWLDLVAVRYAAMINGVSSLAVMLFDVLAGFEHLSICTAYEFDGARTDRFIPDAADLARVTPVFEQHDGFADEITGVRDRAALPEAARRYLDRIEEFVGLPISIVSVGPDREQTIHCG